MLTPENARRYLSGAGIERLAVELHAAEQRVLRAAEAWADKPWPEDGSAEVRELVAAVRALRELRGEGP
jgi:hypothetical protein